MWHYLPLHEYSLLYIAQAAFTIWMLVDASRRGVDGYWFLLIVAFQPIGAWMYFFVHKAKDFRVETGWLAGLFNRQPSLEELRHRTEQAPTVASRLELAERLVKVGEHAEAVQLLDAVLAREPDHGRALFLLAQSHRSLGHAELAAPPLHKLVARQPNWGDYEAWRMLVVVCAEAGDLPEALTQSRELARLAPILQHQCLLAEQLLDKGETAEACKVIEQGLYEYRYLTGPSRRRDRRWVGKAKQLLKEASVAKAPR